MAEIFWLTRLLGEFGLPNICSVAVFCENQTALHIAKNLVFYERTKHIEVDCHFVREQLATRLIPLHHIPTALQLADILTKPLTGVQHRFLVSKLGMDSSLSGDVRNGLTHQPCNWTCVIEMSIQSISLLKLVVYMYIK